MSLQSRFISYREGESGSMNYYGDRLRSLECVAGTKASQDAAHVPCVIDTAGFPLHDNLNPGLKTHKTTSTTPDIGRPGRVLLPY